MRRGPAWAAVGAVLFFGSLSNAATYTYSGITEICPQNVIPCITGSLGVGYPLTGSLAVHDTVVAPDTTFTYVAVTGYTFEIGNFTFVPDNSDLVDGSVYIDDVGNLRDGFLHLFAPALSPGAPPTVLTLDLATASWFMMATVPDSDWPFVVSTGYGSFQPIVPVPGSLGLFLPAIALFVLVGRRG